MAQHIVIDPQGTQHIINAPDDATPEQVMSYAQQNIPQNGNGQGLIDRIGQDYNNNVASAQEIANRGVAENQPDWLTTAEAAARVSGKTAGDVGGELIKSLPNGVQQDLADTVMALRKGASYIPGATAYSNEADKAYNAIPQQGKDALNAVGDTVNGLTTVVPLLKSTGLVSSAIGKTGEAISASGDAAEAAQRAATAQSDVMPDLTKKGAEAAQGNVEVKPGIFGDTHVLQPTDAQIESAKNVSALPDYNPSDTFTKKRIAINNGISEEAEALKSKLNSSGVNYMQQTTEMPKTVPDGFGGVTQTEDVVRHPPVNQFHQVLTDAVNAIPDNATLTGDANAVAQRLADKMHEFVDKNPPTPAGLLEARKNFDGWLEDNRPKIFDPASENAIQVAKDTVRNTANNFIAQTVPDVEVKASLAKQSSLFRARDVLDAKAAQEAPTALKRAADKINDMIPSHPLAKAVAVGAGAYVAPAATAAGLGAYGAGKAAMVAGRALAKPGVRQAIGGAMQGMAQPLELSGAQAQAMKIWKNLKGAK